jgi:PHD-finger
VRENSRSRAAAIGSALSAGMGRSKPTAVRLAAPVTTGDDAAVPAHAGGACEAPDTVHRREEANGVAQPACGIVQATCPNLGDIDGAGKERAADDSDPGTIERGEIDGDVEVMSADEACKVCERTDGARCMVLCDGCSDGYHTTCMRPKRDNVPRGAWLCGSCVSLAVSRSIKLKEVAKFVDQCFCFRCSKSTNSSRPAASKCADCRLAFHAACRVDGDQAAVGSPSAKFELFRCDFCATARATADRRGDDGGGSCVAGAGSTAGARPCIRTTTGAAAVDAVASGTAANDAGGAGAASSATFDAAAVPSLASKSTAQGDTRPTTTAMTPPIVAKGSGKHALSARGKNLQASVKVVGGIGTPPSIAAKRRTRAAPVASGQRRKSERSICVPLSPLGSVPASPAVLNPNRSDSATAPALEVGKEDERVVPPDPLTAFSLNGISADGPTRPLSTAIVAKSSVALEEENPAPDGTLSDRKVCNSLALMNVPSPTLSAPVPVIRSSSESPGKRARHVSPMTAAIAEPSSNARSGKFDENVNASYREERVKRVCVDTQGLESSANATPSMSTKEVATKSEMNDMPPEVGSHTLLAPRNYSGLEDGFPTADASRAAAAASTLAVTVEPVNASLSGDFQAVDESTLQIQSPLPLAPPLVGARAILANESSKAARRSKGAGKSKKMPSGLCIPSHEDDPLFVPPGKIRNWYILNVCVGRPFHSGLFVDLPYGSFFDDGMRIIYTQNGVLRAVAFAKSRCARTEALRSWWLANRQAFPSSQLCPSTLPSEDTLVPTPCD